MDELHSFMNVDVTATAADVDASGDGGWTNYYGMCHLWQCAIPSTMGHHSWHWCAPPLPTHPTKLFFHTILDEPNILTLDDGMQFFIPNDSPQMIGLHAGMRESRGIQKALFLKKLALALFCIFLA